MRPADALDRIVYLLDRTLAEGQKVRACARARDVVDEVGDDEVERLHAHGDLTDLPGIGPTTARVIAEALDGGVPSYLAELEATTTIPDGDGAGMRGALRGDCHTHSTWSDGGASIEKMARTAMALGHEYMVLTDHSPRLTIAHGLSADRLRRQLDEIVVSSDKQRFAFDDTGTRIRANQGRPARPAGRAGRGRGGHGRGRSPVPGQRQRRLARRSRAAALPHQGDLRGRGGRQGMTRRRPTFVTACGSRGWAGAMWAGRWPPGSSRPATRWCSEPGTRPGAT